MRVYAIDRSVGLRGASVKISRAHRPTVLRWTAAAAIPEDKSMLRGYQIALGLYAKEARPTS
jgi:hypothetical protein